jgi:signal transduction histidine kinase
MRRSGEKTLPFWQAWPQVTLAGFCLILAALLWTAMALQWTDRDQRQNQQARLSQIAGRINTSLSLWQQRASALAAMTSQLLGDNRVVAQRSAVEASLRAALSAPNATIDGFALIDAAGRKLLEVAEEGDLPARRPAVTPSIPSLVWHGDTLVLTGALPPVGEGSVQVYQAALSPAALSRMLRRVVDDGTEHVALLLPGDVLVGVVDDILQPLDTVPDLDTAVAAPAALFSSGTADRLVVRLRMATGAIVVEAPVGLGGGHRSWLLLSGASLIALQVVTTLLLLFWIGRYLRRMQARHLHETDQACDRALRSIKDMLDALPATFYRAELFADRSFSLNSVSENVERLTGLNWPAISRPNAWRERIPTADQPALAKHMDTLYREGESTVEYRFEHAEGRTIWLREQARIVAVGQHGGADVTGYLADITGEKLLQAQAVASAKLATLGRMASALAHEITQPISVMMLAAENALDAHESGGHAAMPVMVAKLDRILEQTQRAQSLVEHLRVFGRADDGSAEPVDIGRAAEGALLLSASVLKRAGVEVENLIPRTLPPVMTSQVMLEQVIMNLIINARDAMLRVPDAQRRLTLLADELGDRRVELRVMDTGLGLSPEALARLFEPFFTTKPAGQGMGLGLSICQSIVRSFGGEITGENIEGGATFSIRLPVAPGVASSSWTQTDPGTSREASKHGL